MYRKQLQFWLLIIALVTMAGGMEAQTAKPDATAAHHHYKLIDLVIVVPTWFMRLNRPLGSSGLHAKE